MLTLDAQMAKNAFEERLRQAEHERFAQRFVANRPNAYPPLREMLGDLLITLGTALKAHLPQELVEA